ncbi:MAG TPA: type II and III secretion system protein family protein [Pyrinomonadaceae bacterium]|nr:type II and III secretion system protein family protein [Pyrinomonadaceae bacterium]
MQSRSPMPRRVSLLLASLITIFSYSISHAQENSYKASFQQNKEAIPVNVLVGQSRVINFDRPVGRFSVSNPEIAEAVLVTPDQVLVNGKAFGQVNFIAWEQTGGQFLVFDVYVRANLSLIDSQIRALFPKDDIRLSQANGSVVISGSVANATTASQVQSVIEAANFKVVNMLTSPVTDATQIQLQVRVAEMNRTKLRDYGTSFSSGPPGGTGGYWNSGGGPSTLGDTTTSPAGAIIDTVIQPALNLFIFNRQINTGAMLKLLRTEGAFRELAEPNLIAMNGQQASFLAGGEFPVPVLQMGNSNTGITVMWKEYGIRLNFKPTIIDEDHIRLELEPEVSTIDFSNGVRFNGFVVPALRTRRAKTGVELRDGQSFALAGLLDNSETKTLSRIPVVSSIPVIGALFKSKSFEKKETELMFFVTAKLVKPVSGDDLPNLRGVDGLKGNSPLGVEPKGEGISGQSGYKVSGENGETPASTPVTTPAAPAKSEPKTKAAESTTQTSTSGSVGSVRNLNPQLPVAKARRVDLDPESVRPW